MNEGYMQNKIREQNDRIVALENEMKKLNIKILHSKQRFDQATALMKTTIDIESYKSYILKQVVDVVKKHDKKYFQTMEMRNKKIMDNVMEPLFKDIVKHIDDETDPLWATIGGLCRTLTNKKILLPVDIIKMKEYVDEIRKIGLNGCKKKLIIENEKVKRRIKKHDRMKEE